MNKKVIILCSVAVVALLALVGFGFRALFSDNSKGEAQNEQPRDSRINALSAVPTDAILVIESEVGYYQCLNNKSELYSLLSSISSQTEEWHNAISLHYTSRNHISPLYILSVPFSVEKEGFRKQVLSRYSSLNTIDYDGVQIYHSEIKSGKQTSQIYIASWNNFLLISESSTLIKSSIRHLANKASILDNSTFLELTKQTKGETCIYVGNESLGKLFSGMVNSSYLKYASFTQTISDWTMFNLEVDKDYAVLKGEFKNINNEDKFSNSLSTLQTKNSDLYELLPNASSLVMQMHFESVDDYLAKYKLYLESRKQYRPNPQSRAWLDSLDMRTVAIVDLPLAEKKERLLFVRLGSNNKFKVEDSEIEAFENKDRINVLLGDAFKPSSQYAYTKVEDYLVIGSEKALVNIIDFNENSGSVTLHDYLAQTPASEYVDTPNAFSIIINASEYRGEVSSILKPYYSSQLEGEDSNKNFRYLLLGINGKDIQLEIFNEDLNELPQLTVSQIYQEEVNDNFKIDVPSGPFEVYNFSSKKTNYLQQQSDNTLRLLDHNKRQVRKIAFKNEICGKVEQIDYLKNNKLQMLFAAGNQLWLLDRLGRWVSGFPKNLPSAVLLGPDVYDFRKDKNYVVMILHKDNSLQMYDIDAKPLAAWNKISLKEKIIQMPELLEVGQNKYWVVRTTRQMLIYDYNGIVVADFSKRKRIKAASEIIKKSDYELILTSLEGNEMLLNLRTGSLKRN